MNVIGVGRPEQPIPFVPTASELKSYIPNPDRPANLPQTPMIPVDQRRFVSDPNQEDLRGFKQVPPQTLADGTQRWGFEDPSGYPTSAVYFRPRLLLPDQYYDPRHMTAPATLEELMLMGYQMNPDYFLNQR